MPTILGANSVSGYTISNSVRFNDDDSAALSITPGTASTSRKKWTWSGWIKRGEVPTDDDNDYSRIFNVKADGNNYLISGFLFSSGFNVTAREGNTEVLKFEPSRKFRDHSAWTHIVMAYDSTLGTARNRFRVYFNGEEDTTALDTTPDQNTELVVLEDVIHNIGRDNHGTAYYYDGYMADVYLIDGTQYAASDFGETDDNGVWIPKNFAGSCGTNGFKLEFQQTGTSQNSSGIGADTSGNDNHLAVTNLVATDVTTDTPTNNFCTLNSVDADPTAPTLAEGNLDYHSVSGTAFNPVRSTMAVTRGKWYAEWKYINTAGFLGVITTQSPLEENIVSDANVRCILRIPAGYYAVRNNSGSGTDIGDDSQTFSDNDIGQVALDMDNGYVYFGINGTYLKGQDGSTTGNPAGNNGSAGGAANHPTQLMTDQHDGVIAFMAGDYTQNTTGQIQCNFGGGAPFAISSGNADGEGHGNFEFAPPSGFFALCTKNLAKYG